MSACRCWIIFSGHFSTNYFTTLSMCSEICHSCHLVIFAHAPKAKKDGCLVLELPVYLITAISFEIKKNQTNKQTNKQKQTTKQKQQTRTTNNKQNKTKTKQKTKQNKIKYS